MKDIIGFYQSREQAERVQAELVAAGFDRSDITIYDRAGQNDEPGFWQSIKEAFGAADEDDQELYAEAARRGAIAVGLNYDRDDNPQVAAQIMSRHGAIDLDQQSAQWRQQGWTGGTRRTQTANTGTANLGGTAAGATGRAATAGQQREVIPVVQEELRVGKREVAAGGIRIHTRVTERPVREQISLREERVNVERHPVDRPITNADDAFRERAVEVTARAEQAVVAKNARVVEEIVVNKEVGQRTETVQDSVRRTDVDVQKTAGQQSAGRATEFAPDTFAQEIAADTRFRGRDWTTVEPEARRHYESRYPGGKWEQVKDTVRRGYDNVRNKV
jgi:uncharacterized protein (TIGR02271 family)